MERQQIPQNGWNTYNFELLHCLFTHVHPSGLLHLHQAQVLRHGRQRGETTNGSEFDFACKFFTLGKKANLARKAKTSKQRGGVKIKSEPSLISLPSALSWVTRLRLLGAKFTAA